METFRCSYLTQIYHEFLNQWSDDGYRHFPNDRHGGKPDPDIQRLLSNAAVLTSSIGLR